MARRRTFGTSFSWRRATGVSAAKGRISRAIGVPSTRSGRQRKARRIATKYVVSPILVLLLLVMVGQCIGGH